MSPNTRLCFDERRASSHQRMCWQPAVAMPAITPPLKGSDSSVRNSGRSGGVGDKWQRGTRSVMKANFMTKKRRQVHFFPVYFSSYTHLHNEVKSSHPITESFSPCTPSVINLPSEHGNNLSLLGRGELVKLCCICLQLSLQLNAE